IIMWILYIARVKKTKLFRTDVVLFSPKRKQLWKHTTPNSWDYKKIVLSNKYFPIARKEFYFLKFNHRFGRLSRKQDSKMTDFQTLLSGLRMSSHEPHAAIRVSRGERMTLDRRQFV